jgi:hypothetical protein
MSGCGRTHRAKHVERQFLDEEWEGLDSKRGDRLALVLEAPQGKSVRVHWVADLLLAEKDEASTAAPNTTTATSSTSSSTSTGFPHHSLPQTSASGQIIALPVPSSSSAPTQASEKDKKPIAVQYITIPGKFFRVIWLGKGDIIVVRDGLMDRKLTESHLQAFLERKESVAPPVPVELTSLLEQIRFILHANDAENAKDSAGASLAEKGEEAVGGEGAEGEEGEEVEQEEEDDIMVNPNRRGRDTQYVSSGRYRTTAAQEEEDDEEEEEEGEEGEQ